MGRNSSDHSESPVRNHRSSHRSPLRRERSGRSPGRDRASRHPKPPPIYSPPREKASSHTRSSKQTPASPVRANSRSPSPRSKRLRRDRSNNKDDKPSERGHGKTRSPASHESRSPSPRTRRLRRAQADKADEMKGRGHASGSDKVTHKERDSDGNGNGSSKSRHGGEGHRSRHKSDSPPAARGARDEGNNSRGDHQNGNDDDSVAQMKAAEEALATKEKQKPSFELSGKLAAETNRVKGVTLLFTEPPDARKPEIRWRLYVFKGGEVLNEPLYVHRQTCYLFGRERRVADIPTDHPSCSKQHAVLQYRQVEVEQPDGMLAMKIRPYIMDLGSTNGTFINDNRIEAERYYELMEKDTIKFGNSSREYVLLHENSA